MLLQVDFFNDLPDESKGGKRVRQEQRKPYISSRKNPRETSDKANPGSGALGQTSYRTDDRPKRVESE